MLPVLAKICTTILPAKKLDQVASVCRMVGASADVALRLCGSVEEASLETPKGPRKEGASSLEAEDFEPQMVPA